MNISVFITNWNGLSNGYLQDALPSIVEAVRNYSGGESEIILVDDRSEDESVDYVKKNFPEISVVITSKNMGYQGASNFAVRSCRYEILLSLNNDIKLERDVLNRIVKHFKDPGVFAVSTKVFLWDEKTYLAGKRTAKIEKGLFKIRDSGERVEKIENTLFATGGAAAFRKSMYEDLGGFDEIYYPLYWEDIDICYRALKRGWKVLYDPSCVMYHKHQATIQIQYNRKNIRHITARNSYIFFWINIRDRKKLRAHFLWQVPLLLADLMRGRFRFISAFFRAIIKADEVWIRRFQNRKFEKRSDIEILNFLEEG